jgi:catechol 2,3-dioxygenase
MALSWSHTVLLVRDREKMLDFYTRVLGFDITDQGPIPTGQEIIFLSQNPEEHHQIGMMTARSDDGPSNSHAHIAFRTESIDELRDFIAGVEGEDISYRPTSHGNTWSIYFQDPEQNGVEIFCDTPWHVQQPQGAVWDTKLDDDALQAWTLETFKNQPGFTEKASYVARRRKERASA